MKKQPSTEVRDNGASSNSADTAPIQTVAVFQGGGALGAYQAGVYQALHESEIEPDWIVGTSIGAINAALIVGNEPENRLKKLEEFWDRMAHKNYWSSETVWPVATQAMANINTIIKGIPGFFSPNPFAFWGPNVVLGKESAGYYSTSELEKTLLELVDFDLINQRKTRLTVGAAHVRTSKMHYFDSRDMEINVKHILASSALPPAFPAVRIDGELYWDGGILSNTPAEVVFDDNPRRNSLVFAVHLWNPDGQEPETIGEVLNRHKDVQFSSRVSTHIARQQQVHQLRHVITQLAALIPEQDRQSDKFRELASWGCKTQMHVVRLLTPQLATDDHTKDVDFSPTRIRKRWDTGYANALQSILQAPWKGNFDPLQGVFLHELAHSEPEVSHS